MTHFVGVSAEERWKNDMLTAQLETNRLLSELLVYNAQVVEPVKVVKLSPVKPVQRRRKKVQ
jgi:hypothetical protein